MRKVFLTLAPLLFACSVSAQWSTNAAGIFYNNGNVGIGTTTPDQSLSLNKTSGLNYISFQNSGVSKAFMGISALADNPIVGMSAGDLGIRTQGDDIFFSTNSGSSGS